MLVPLLYIVKSLSHMCIYAWKEYFTGISVSIIGCHIRVKHINIMASATLNAKLVKMYRICEWNDAARRVLQEIIWVHSVLERKNRVIIFLVCICARNVEQSSAGYEQEKKSLWEDRQHWSLLFLEQLTSQTSIYCNLTANKLQLLRVKPSLLTECGVYLAYPFLQSPSSLHPIHRALLPVGSLFCYHVLSVVSSSPPPLLLL